MFALSLPLLVAATGLSVDVGYWNQNETKLQSAADAAALAAAMNDSRLGQTTAAGKGTAALPYAKAAGDAASNNAFGFVAGTAGTSLTLSVNIGAAQTKSSATVASTTYTVTASIQRPVFFSGVSGLGLSGMSAGTQTATATASVVSTTTGSAGGCLTTLGTSGTDIYATGGASINAANCNGTGIVSDSTASCTGSGSTATNGSISVQPSATITTTSVESAGCVAVNSNGGAKITSPTSGGTVSYSTGSVSDPYAALAAAGFPEWPSQPAIPALSNTESGATAASSLGYVAAFSDAWGGCSGSYTAQCWLNPYEFTSAFSPNVASLELKTGSDGLNYDSTYAFNGEASLSPNGSAGLTFDGTASVPGTYYFSGTSKSSCSSIAVDTTSTYGLALSTPKITWGTGGIYYFNGGWTVDGSSPTMSIGTSTMLSTSYCGASNGATYLQEGNLTFAGGTYYFDGGLIIGGSANVTFGPGIYYIVNGPFTVSNGGSLTANGATFILEGSAYYDFAGGATLSLAAPLPNDPDDPTNCVLPFASSGTISTPYPNSSYMIGGKMVASASTPTYGTPTYKNASSAVSPGLPFPWDGTNGQGICDLVLYQAPTDSATDYVIEGSGSKINGIIYTPDAQLQLSGAGSLAAAANADGSTGTLAIIANSVSMTGSGSLTLSSGSSTSSYGLSGSTTSSQVLLTN